MSISGKVRSDAWFSLIQFIVSTARGIITIPLITQLLGEDSYGIWATAFAVIAFVATVGEIHLHGALVRYGSQEETTGQTYSDTITLATTSGILCGIVVVLVSIFVDLGSLLNATGTEFNDVIFISGIVIFLTITLKININFPRSMGNVKQYEGLRIIQNALETVLLAVVFLSGFGILTGLISLAVFAAIFNVVLVLYIVRVYNPPKPCLDNFKKYLTYCVPLIPYELSKSVLQNTDKYLLLYFISPAAVGIYAVVYSVSNIFKKFTSILNSTLYPTVASAWDNNNFDEIERLYGIILRYYSIIAIPAFFGLVILSEPILSLISTDTISDAGGIILPIIAFGFLLRGFDNPLSYILTSAENTGIIGKTVLVAAGINIILNIVLIPHFEIIGAAFATLISCVVILTSKSYYSYKEIQFDIPYITIIKAIASSIIMYLILSQFPKVDNLIAHIGIYSTTGAIIYFVIMYLIGGINKSEIKYFINKVR